MYFLVELTGADSTCGHMVTCAMDGAWPEITHTEHSACSVSHSKTAWHAQPQAQG